MSTLFPIFEIRFLPFLLSFLLSVAFAIALILFPHTSWLWIGFGIAALLLLVGLLARLSRPDDVDARRFYRTTAFNAVLFVGALSWTKLVVHPVLAGTFLLALYVAPPVA